MPVIVLVINVAVVHEVRRASKHAAANLGLQRQPSSSNSAVPTILMVITSLVYVLLSGTFSIFFLAFQWTLDVPLSPACQNFIYYGYMFSHALSYFLFAYNFYVYLITGKQFRSELRKLFCDRSANRPISSSSPVTNNVNNSAVRIARHAHNNTSL